MKRTVSKSVKRNTSQSCHRHLLVHWAYHDQFRGALREYRDFCDRFLGALGYSFLIEESLRL
jgi:hypothetical protein